MRYLFPALCWAVIVAGALGACTKRPLPPAPEPAPHQMEVITLPDPNEEILRLDPEWRYQAPSWTLYFSFNSAAMIDTGMAASLAKYMLDHPGDIATLTGHASEEGASEYNLALGARRAQAVRGYLESRGISENRINWKSMGEEMPATHDPVSIHLNRRVEILLEEPK